MKYSPKDIESKWQKYWEESGINRVDLDNAKKPFYNLMMFPYPSAEGLHVGNMYAFTHSDAFGRFMRLKGFDVFEPIGLDGFGIHSENYAIKIKEHIKDVSKRTEKHFYEQLHMIGNQYDWSRKVETYKPEYYKWTQWLFLQMYKKGLAYRAKAPVNWCPSCKTVLSDEQIVSAQCERCGTQTEKRQMEQWFFKITDYAEKLLKNLDSLDWPQDVKTIQRNWIGKREGAIVKFVIARSDPRATKQSRDISTVQERIGDGCDPRDRHAPIAIGARDDFFVEVFTTRPDTIFGATFLVVCPEHSLIQDFKDQIENIKEIEEYIVKAKQKSSLERTDLNKDKTGIEIKGLKAVNPANQKEIPIFVADYVLAEYGTGAIMAVPAHDERDFEFAKKYDLPVMQVVLKENTPVKSILWLNNASDEEIERIGIKIVEKIKADSKMHDIFIRKVEFDQKLTEKFETFVSEKLEPLYWVEYVGPGGIKYLFKHEDGSIEKIELNSDTEEKISKLSFEFYYNKSTDKKWEKDSVWKGLAQVDNGFYADLIIHTEDGISVNSGEFTGVESSEARKKITEWLEKNNLGKRAVNYKLRDWCVSRQRYWGPPIPIVYCQNCAKKKIKILVLHGVTGSSKENWFPWLKDEAEKESAELFCPDLPNADNPKLDEWMEFLTPYVKNLDENSIIIGHSLGATAALHLLKKANKKIDKVILVAPTSADMDIDGFREKYQNDEYFSKKTIDSIENFVNEKMDWGSIKNNANNFVFFFSENDPYVDLKAVDYYKEKLEGEFIILKNKGHFNQGSGIVEFTEVLPYLNLNRNLGIQPVPERDLPVTLPEMEDFLPDGSGKGPLNKNSEFVNTICPQCGGPAKRETDVSDPFVDSCWYYLRYTSTEFNDKPFDKDRLAKWMPVNMYIGGKEHAVLHLLYSRFVSMVMKDLGYLKEEEPFKRFFAHGLLIREGAKMSKSKGNVINPDEYIKKFGADSVRSYLMFMGDVRLGGDWRDEGMNGMFRFMSRVWTICETIIEKGIKKTADEDILKSSHKAIKRVGDDLEKLKFNTAISAIMEYVNALYLAESAKKEIGIDSIAILAQLIAPFAPHLAEEIWAQCGNTPSIFQNGWPEYDEKLIKEEQIEIPVQINGKMRGKIFASPEISQDEAVELAMKDESIKKWLEGKEPKKIIFVAGKLINIVV